MRPPADPTHLSRCAAELDVLLGALSDLYFRCDAEDRLIDYRARAPHELYVPPETFLGKTFSDVIAPEAAALLREGLRSAREGGAPVLCEYDLPMPGGLEHYQARLVPVPDGIVLAFIDNVTAKQRAARRQVEALSLVRATLESTADGILVVDRHLRMVDWNQRFVELWGIPRDLLDQRDDELTLRFVQSQLVEPEAFVERVHELYAHPEVESSDLLFFKDGRAIERYSRPQRTGDQIVGRVWSFRDVTAARDAALTREDLLAEARAAVRIRDEFLSIASHELRTPLTSSQLALQVVQQWLRRSEAPPLPAFFHGALETAMRQGRLLARLVDDLLSVARIRAGRLELRLEPIDLGELCREILATLADPLAQAGCAARLTIPDDATIRGRWDRVRLGQVLTNLLTNALRYGAGAPIEVTLSADDHEAQITVRDHGVGIPPDQQERIFDRFERLASSSHYGGLGLGLYIVRQLVEAHGGRVTVQSAPHQGATFTLRLPR